MELSTRVDRLEQAFATLMGAASDTHAALRQLAEAQRQTQAQVAQLAEAQRQTQAQVTQLVEAQRQTQAQVTQLVEAQRRTEQQLGTLIAWQQGERGRREGERYEQTLVRRGPRIFQGGWGGSTHEEVIRSHLAAVLQPVLHEDVRPDADPFLADALWWKDEQVAVVEASLVIDEDDVNRAQHRAETLRRAGTQTLPVVIGDAWDSGETQFWAQAHRVEWWVGSELSEGLIAFRRRPGSTARPNG